MPPAVSPAVTVVVPTYRRARALGRCLEALASVVPPVGGFEVVVVDDGSPEPPRQVVREVEDRLDVRLVEASHRGPAAARNTGAEAGRSRWLAFTDDDCRPEPDWLVELVAALERQPDALVAGRAENSDPAHLWAAANQLLLDHLAVEEKRVGGPPPFFTSNNLAAGRQRFLDLGGFDESFPLAAGEDRDLSDRWRRGGPLVSHPAARVLHDHFPSARRYAAMHVRYGRGAHRFEELRAERGDEFPVPRPGFYLRLVRSPWRETASAGPSPWALAGALLVSQVAHAVGFVRQRVDERLRSRRSGSAAASTSAGTGGSGAPGDPPTAAGNGSPPRDTRAPY